MKTSIVKVLSIIIFMAMIFSCSEDDTDVTGGGTIIWKVNGVQESGTPTGSTLFKGTAAQSGNVDAKRLDIRGLKSDGSGIILTISEIRTPLTNDCIMEDLFDIDWLGSNYCVDHMGTDVCEGALGTYFTSATTYEITDPTLDNGNVTITSCYATNQRMSGTFSFTISDFFTEDVLYTITEGVFTDVSYPLFSS